MEKKLILQIIIFRLYWLPQTKSTQEKAAGLGVNCGCQCSSPSLTFQVCWFGVDLNGGVVVYVEMV